MTHIDIVKANYPDAIAVSNGMEETVILAYIIVRIDGRTWQEIKSTHHGIHSTNGQFKDVLSNDTELSMWKNTIEKAWKDASERISRFMLTKLES